MPDEPEKEAGASPDAKSAGLLGFLSGNAIGLLTFLASSISVLATWKTQSIVNGYNHAGAVTDEFVKNLTPLTTYFTSNKHGDEEAADIDLTALEDFAQTPDDQIALLTIAARMLNPTACRSDGEATARFVTALISRLKIEHSQGSELILKFVRSRGFLDLASSDVTTVYYNDDDVQETDYCSDTPKAAPQKTSKTRSASELTTAKPTPKPKPTAAAYERMLAMSRRRATPDNADQRNHATYWGEQTAWNDSKNDLFRELRPDDYDGWIHVATWETADACVDARGRPFAKQLHTECGAPIRINYTSTAFAYRLGDRTILQAPFWVGRARYLRDAAPRIYDHAGDSTMQQRGSLGRVIGAIEHGECVAPQDVRYYTVAPNADRSFVHVWVRVRPAQACDDPAQTGSGKA
jgi:hypothetical protein